MQTIQESFSTVVQKIGFGKLAKQAGVAYQTVSDFATDPRPGHKFRIRGRILDTVIDQSVERVSQLRKEADELEQQISGFQKWRTEEFSN